MDDNRLNDARKIINEVDSKIVKLFEQRMQAAKMVAEYKKEHGLQIYVPEREEALIQKNSALIENEALLGYYSDFQRQMMRVSRAYQSRLNEGMKVSYSGIEGAYAHIAAKRLFPAAQVISYPNFNEAYQSVVDGQADVVILPIENSSAGEVGQVSDLLFSGPLFINGTYDLTIDHVLVGLPGSKLEDIKTVISHTQALNQCASYIHKHGFLQLAYENTALAAQYVVSEQNKAFAAIASKETAEIYGLQILDWNIATNRNNTTRFFILSAVANKIESLQNVFSGIMFTVNHEAGSLARALNSIGSYGYNLRTLRSRPMKDLMWSYYFYAEIEGNLNTANGKEMLESLELSCHQVKVLGTFEQQTINEDV